jgi:23S rRNA (adenine2030-N6)-methyltransferase
VNYRHAFHAGNFADVFKHALLTRILVYLMRKETPLRYIDTHAGVGQYNLSADEAVRTGEWRDGIGRLAEADIPADARDLLKPYLDILRLTPGVAPQSYPGSPVIAQRLLRPIDRLTMCELHEHDARMLNRAIGRDRRVKAIRIDGYVGLNAYIPPVERRGLVLIDPPFEDRDEFDRLAAAIEGAWAKWPTGCYALWYPLKRPLEAAAFARRLGGGDLRRVLRLELDVDTVVEDRPLAGNGMIVVNPPFPLEAEARVILPWLSRTLARGTGAGWRVDWLAGE